MAQGKATEVDNALLSRSSGAVTLLTAVEGNNKALKSIKDRASVELRNNSQIQNADVFSGVRYKHAEDIEHGANESENGVFDKTVGTRKKYATQEEVDRYIDYAYLYAEETNKKGNIDFPKQKSGIVIGEADERLINDIKANFGVDLTGALHVIRDNDVRHTKNSHGEETNEKYAVTAEDQKKIPDIIKNYDDVLYVKSGDKEGIYYVKRHNGVTYYLEAIRDEGRILSNKQMIKVPTGEIPDIKGLKDAINKKWNMNSGPNDNNIPRMYVQDVENNHVPDNRVPQNKPTVKDGDIYSQGKRVSIPEGAKKSDNIVITEESERFRKKNPEGYKITKILAKDLGMKVMFVDGLVDADGNILDGAITSEGIFINSNAKDIGKFAVTHEFSHRMKNTAPEAWAKYQEHVIEREKVNGRYYAAYELKKGSYDKKYYTAKELTAVIDEEIACDYIGDMFSSESELAAFIEANRSTAVTVRDVYYGILDRLGLLDEKKKAQFLWRKAYREAVLNKDVKSNGEVKGAKESVSGTRLSENISKKYDTPETLNSGVINQSILKQYKKDVDSILAGTYKGDDVLVMGGTPKIYTDIGLNKLPITIDKKHVYSIAKTEIEAKSEGNYKKGVNYHGLGEDAVKNIIYEISEPVAVVAHPDFAQHNKSTNKKRDSTHKVIAIVEFNVNGKNVIAPIEIDSELSYKNNRIDANNIATYFDKKNISDILKEAVALENRNYVGFYFADKKRTEVLLKQSGYQLPSRLRTHGSNTIIRTVSENVNREIDTVLKSKQFARFFGDWQNNPETVWGRTVWGRGIFCATTCK